MNDHKTSLFKEDGSFIGVDGIVCDVTARKQVEVALREGEARMRAIVDTAVDGIITIDEHRIVQSFNPAAANIFGYAHDEVIGQNVNIYARALPQ